MEPRQGDFSRGRESDLSYCRMDTECAGSQEFDHRFEFLPDRPVQFMAIEQRLGISLGVALLETNCRSVKGREHA